MEILCAMANAAGTSGAMKKMRQRVQVIDGALPPALFSRVRRAIARLKGERQRQSYWTTFWMPLGRRPQNAVEEAVLALRPLALPGAHGCLGAEWWIGRSHTTAVPIELHFDQDVMLREAGGPLVHPRRSSVLFFNRVRGGQLVVTDQQPDRRGAPHPAQATELHAVAPRANRYASWNGDLFHGVLDARGRIPERRLPGPRGRLRLALVVNFWDRRPKGVPEWPESRAYRGLQTARERAAIPGAR
jgi:hypothetical protein